MKVELASGEIQLRQCSDSRTLLVDHPVQSIIPMAKVTELGYTVRWDRGGCSIEHGSEAPLKVTMVQGCPVLTEQEGARVMLQVEDMEKRKARVRAIMDCGVMAEGWFEKEVAQLRAQFPQDPQRILERMVGAEECDTAQLPINRRRRRTIMQAKRIIINMFSGPAEERWRHLEKAGTYRYTVRYQCIGSLRPEVDHVCGRIGQGGTLVVRTPMSNGVSLSKSSAPRSGSTSVENKVHGEKNALE